MKKYRKRNTYFDVNNNDPNEKYNSNIDTFHNKKMKEYEKYEKNEIPKLKNEIQKMEKKLNKIEPESLSYIETKEEILIIRITYSAQLPTLETVVKKIKEDNGNELNLDVKDNNIGNDIKKILDVFPEGKVLKN